MNFGSYRVLTNDTKIYILSESVQHTSSSPDGAKCVELVGGTALTQFERRDKMPNHVENDLFIRGPETQINEVLATIGATRNPPEFDFNTLIPYPETWAQMDKDAEKMYTAKTPDEQQEASNAYFAKWNTLMDGFNSGGHDWCVSNWGTKWNAYETVAIFDQPHIYDDVKRARVSFRTAWSAPLPVVEKLAELYPDVEISLEYFERGMGFAGGVSYTERKYVEMGECRKSQWHTDQYKGSRGG